MNLLFCISSVAVRVGEGVLNAHAAEEEVAGVGLNGGNFSFSLCPSLFAPLTPALAEALYEGSQGPVRSMSKRGARENGPSSDHNS